MAHFAKVENGIVEQVIVIADEDETDGQNFINNVLGLDGIWLQTSVNTRNGVHLAGKIPLRKNFAGIGFTYDAAKDAFIPPKPYASWILNEESCNWEAPIPLPTDGKVYFWNENNTNWELAPETESIEQAE